MCLTKLKRFGIKLDENGVGEGWKVFNRQMDGALHADYFGDTARPERKWLDEIDFCCCPWEREKKEVLLKAGKSFYKPGWHIFLRKKDAENWLKDRAEEGNVLKRVKFRNILALGTQVFYGKTIVAKEIFIPK